MKLLNLSDTKETPAVDIPQPVKVLRESAKPEIPETPPPVQHKKRPRKAIVKHMKIEKLSEPGFENPALKPPSGTDKADAIPKVYVRGMGERQIVSIPLLLINEQLGAAVERFNSCACDDCLRIITNRALDLMPPMYVRVLNAADEDEVNRLIRERRAEAIRVLAKICIGANKKPFH
ncbi:MAG: hypothetical protein LBC82_06510 [Oscillospiraceae bacterium]|nr:hypothetical protein [Oscillospiraceae bacterium]